MAGPIRIAILGDASNAVKAFHVTESAATGMRSRLGSAVGGIAKVAAGVAVAAGGVAASMGMIGLKSAAAMQQSNIAFSTMLGSSKAAANMMGDLSAFAAKTPFEMPGLTAAAKQLIGVGMSSKKVIPTLTAFGDASSALGLDQEQFNRIMLATTQSMGKGKVQAEEMMQMTEAGLPVWPMLSKAVGLPIPKLMEMAQKGQLLATDVFPALQAQMSKDYGGAMIKQSETLSGRWSTLKDTIRNGLGQAILPLAPALGGATAGINTFAEGGLKKLATFITGTVVPAIDKFRAQWKANVEGTLGGEVRDLLSGIGGAFGTMFQGGKATSEGFFNFMETKVIPAIQSFKKNWQEATSGTVAGELHQILAGIAETFTSLVSGMAGGSGEAGGQLKELAGSVKELGPAVGQVKDAMPGFADVLNVANTVIGYLAEHTETLAKWMPTIVAFFIAWKLAQMANNLAAVASIPIQLMQIATQRKLNKSNKALVMSLAEATGAQKVATGAAQTDVAASNAGMLARARAAVSMVAHKAATLAIAAATKVWAGVQWLLNAAMSANPIGLIILAVVALIAIIVLIATKTTWFQTIWKAVWTAIKVAGMAIWNAIKFAFAAWMAYLKAIITVGLAVIKGVWAGLKWLGTLAASIWGGIKNAFQTAVQFVRNAVQWCIDKVLAVWGRIRDMASVAGDLIGKVRGIFQGWWDWMVALPGKIIDGLVGGFRAGWHLVTDFVASMVDKLPQVVQDVLGMSSPSRVFYELGTNTTQGLADGIAAKKRIAAAAAAATAKKAAEAAAKANKVAAAKAAAAAKKRAADALRAQKAAAAKVVAARKKAATAAAKAAAGRATAKTGLRKLLPDMAKGLTGTPAQIKAMSDKMIAGVQKAFTGRQQTALVKRIATDTARLQTYAAKRDAVAARMNTANAALQEQQKARAEMAADISSTVRSSFALVAQGEEAGIVSTTKIIERAQKALLQAQQFSTALANLKAKGLNQAMLTELAKAGPEAGLKTAQALASASEAEMSRLNSTYAQIGAVADRTGDTVAGAMYDAGIKAAQGIVAGLAKEKAAIEKTMLVIATGMQTAIKRALGIHSPSSVFRRFGEATITGFAEGFESVSGADLMGDLSSELTRAVPAIVAPPIAGVAGGGITGGGGAVFNINVTDMHADPAEVGRQVVKQVRAYEKATGRPVLVT